LETEPPSEPFPLFLLNTQDTALLLAGLVILILIICSALVSGSEIAYFSLSKSNSDYSAKNATGAKQKIGLLLQRPDYLLATILVTNNFLNVAIIVLSTFVFNKLLSSLNATLQFFITTVLVTAILVLFGEIAPKIYANMNPEGWAKLMARPLNFLRKIFHPINFLLVSTTGIIERRLEKRSRIAGSISKKEIDHAIELTVTDDDTTKKDVSILKGIVNFSDLMVKQIMKTRVDVKAIEITATFPEVLKIVRESGYSRIPVYHEDLDEVKGLLYAKDLLSHLNENENFRWQKLLRKTFYVPETKKIDDLLTDIQTNRKHMAVVVDEYGGTAGIVTLEDVLEEVVGEIRDEFDKEEEILHRQISPTEYVFQGRTMLNDFYRITGIDSEKLDIVRGDSDSLAGLILELAGELPELNKEFSIENYRFQIEEKDERRIKQVRVKILDE